MWESTLVGPLPVHLDFVNGHDLRHDRLKIVVVPPRTRQRRGSFRPYPVHRVAGPEPRLAGAPMAVDVPSARGRRDGPQGSR